MRASPTSILHLMQLPKQQFVIPVYQRTYKWTRIHCGQLLHDIQNVKNPNSKNHFIGSIVYISDQNTLATQVKPLTIIDGQQRLTTISLLLIAIRDYLEKFNNPNLPIQSDEIQQYLVNTHSKPNEYIKLQLTRQDKEIFDALVKKEKIDVEYHSILNNYQYFLDFLKSGQYDIESIYNGIARLIIVEVSLDREYDDPQLIFESLNSTGEKLTEADLIRNFILMDLNASFQQKIYEQYWHRIEQKLSEENGELSNFIRDYLTYKNKNIPKKASVYNEFKKHFLQKYSRKQDDIETLMKDLLLFSTYYERILKQNERDEEINSCLRDLDSIDIKVINPLLLGLYYDYEHNLLTQKEFIRILILIESYLIRRVICGYPTQGLNKVFLSLIKDIDRNNYLESFERNLAKKSGTHRFPNNDEFKKSFIVKDIYNLSNKNRKYILYKLENHNSKERLDIDSEITIEHIMPQSKKLSEKWINALGENWREIHNTYLHTIGNLTLSGYNKNMSNKFFTEKRDMEKGFKDSTARLNQGLKELSTWNESEIIKRAESLFTIAEKAWIYPDVGISSIFEEYKTIITLDDDWTGQKPHSFEFIGEKYEVRDITDLYTSVITKIYELHSERFLEVINQDDLLTKRFHSFNKNDFNQTGREISRNLFINTNINSEAKRKNLELLFEKMDIDEEDLIIYLD
jgi:uncharacterized protein with ParB-like and HNH nuclease domain